MTLARLLRWLTRFRRIQPAVGRVHAAVLRASRGRLRRSRVLAVTAREAKGEEAERLWRAFVAQLPATANSLALARRDVPVLVLEPVRA